MPTTTADTLILLNEKVEALIEKAKDGGGAIPTIGFVPTAYDEEGYVTEGTLYGMSEIPDKYFSLKGYSSSGAGYSGSPFFSKMQTVKFSVPLTKIGDYAFDSVPITQIDLSTVQEIGKSNFYNNTTLIEIDLSSVVNIGDNAFYGCVAIKIESLKLPSTLISLGTTSFQGCKGLTGTIEIPGSVKTIGGRCFMQCDGVSKFILNEGTETLETGAFRQVRSQDWIFPASIKTIAGSYGNFGIAGTATFKGTPESIATDVFSSTGMTVINVPWAEGEVEGAPWGAAKAVINYNYVEGEA